MMKTVVNLTTQSVLGEIENVLDTYAYYPYQQVFAIPDLRQELIDYVLSRIPCFYSAISDEQLSLKSCDTESVLNRKLLRSPLEQQQHLQRLIHEGVYSIFQKKSDWISQQLCQAVEIGCEPSHWFG